MKKTILTGFSLIEILVSLIIISLITAAFAPIITKKLSISSMVLNGSISGGNSGNNSGGNHTGNNTLPSLIKSQEDCDKIANSLVFLSQEQNGGKAACVTKANVGDTYRYGPEISSATGVTIVNSGASCGSGDDSKCCWLGNNGESTSNYCEDSGNGDSTYSGCKRTVCTWAAAKSVCENWEPVEGTKGKWRLPKNEELAAWGRSISTINRNQGFAGLQLCDRYSGYGSVQCMGYKACLGTTDGMCNPLYVWSGTEASSNQARYYYLQSGNFSADYDSINRAFSARCVLDEDSWKETTGATEPKDPDQEIPDSNKPFYGSLPTDITSQSDCDKLARNLYFISAENNGGVAACVTKANVGDTYMYGPEISVAADVSVVNKREDCTTSDYGDKCCWVGNNINQTAQTCDDNNGGYSGCKRTTCNWAAADAICNAWAPVAETKGYWRLPRHDELENWKVDVISDNKGTDGLQLCKYANSTVFAQCYSNYSSPYNYPYAIWSQTQSPRRGYMHNYYSDNSSYSSYNSSTLSARCMIDATTIQNINKKLNNNFILPDGINSQKDCDKMGVNLLYIEPSYYDEKSACITTVNIGDTFALGYDIPSSAGVTTVKTGKTCGSENDYSTKCCWTGSTTGGMSGGNDTQKGSNYSGRDRTVCNWAAAKAICNNFEPLAKTKGRWVLPEHYLYYEGTNIKLQVCSSSSPSDSDNYYRISNCAGVNTCLGASGNRCRPAFIWHNASTDSTTSRYLEVTNCNDGGSHCTESNTTGSKTIAASVRCVITDSMVRAINNVDNLPDTISSQADCNKLGKNLMYLTAEQNGGTAACVTKINVGDTYMNGPEVTSRNLTFYKISEAGSGCYYGNNLLQTAGNNDCTISGNGNSTYSGCKRSLCSRSYGSIACQNWESVAGTKGYWRLPTLNEATTWAKKINEISNSQGSNGLQFCDENDDTKGAVKCPSDSSWRYNAEPYRMAFPSYIWVGASKTALKLSDGKATIETDLNDYQHSSYGDRVYIGSTRCVLDQTALTKLKNWEAP